MRLSGLSGQQSNRVMIRHLEWNGVKQLIVRGIDEELAGSIRRLARCEGLSVNQAALKLLRKGAGLTEDENGVERVGSSLDHLIGAWTPVEADEMDAALAELDVIDRAAWP